MTAMTDIPQLTTMTAVVQDRYGTADRWRVGGRPIPTIASDEVLVEVHAAGLDRGTQHLMAGEPYAMRLVYGLRGPRNPVPGLDLAGRVVAVGDAVTRFHVGDDVFGIGKGSFARFAAAKESKLARMPANLRYEQAAAVAVSGLTAIQAVCDVGRVEAGQQVLITGASGGVGTFAVQIAKAVGATVTGVCSAAKVDLVRSLGADHVIDYQHEDVTACDTRYDLIVDMVSTSSLSQLRSMLTDHGTLVVGGAEDMGMWLGMGRQLRAVTLSPFVSQRLVMLVSKEHFSGLERLGDMIERGEVTPAVERTFPLAEAPEAMRQLEAGTVRGKLVISVCGSIPMRRAIEKLPQT
jgi:NADPH:quinone reductase-like Zn-dependent oxidoreductase